MFLRKRTWKTYSPVDDKRREKRFVSYLNALVNCECHIRPKQKSLTLSQILNMTLHLRRTPHNSLCYTFTCVSSFVVHEIIVIELFYPCHLKIKKQTVDFVKLYVVQNTRKRSIKQGISTQTMGIAVWRQQPPSPPTPPVGVYWGRRSCP